MPTYDELPGWEMRGEPPPHDHQFEIERERLRQERAARCAEERRLIEKRRARSSVAPPPAKR